ncbi:MAG: hypothetical protein BA872_06855 [Desulfobacterales bacterium C00003060]|nr:MAG: hypothetical protein BA861_08745 [Desulfobacterales bacterium S3730MH5]OEU79377.1 MAG: hypothetical protein BA872_06855 [Desulfobacterales bacterium C00003060]
MKPTNSTDTKGFTLLEILIAMFIFAVVLSTIYTSYTGTFRIINETEYEADVYGMARISLERMLEDLESVCVSQYPESAESDDNRAQVFEFVGEDREIKGRSSDDLRFTSMAHLVFSEQDQVLGTAKIGYHVRENDEEEALVLYRTDVPAVVVACGEDTGRQVLCERLLSVDFTYYDADGEEYDNWDSRTEAFRNRIPEMVSIVLEFMNKSDPEAPFRFFTKVALPMGHG